MEVQNRTFLISGGGSGLGAATAQLLVKSGANIVISDIDNATGQTVAQNLAGSACFVKTDVTNEESVQHAVDTTLKTFGSLDGAINCAGIFRAGKIFSQTGPHNLDSFIKVVQVNLIGTFNVIRFAAVAMAKNKPNSSGERGIIVNTASIAAFDGQSGQAAYSASKGGVVAMTLPIARDLAPIGIRVMTIAPGSFDTPMLAGLPPAIKKSLAEQIPFPSRLGKPVEYAALVKHIIENEMLNGEVIRLDGAIRLKP